MPPGWRCRWRISVVSRLGLLIGNRWMSRLQIVLVVLESANCSFLFRWLLPLLHIPLLPLSFTLNWITVILSTVNFLSLNYLVSSRSRAHLLVLSLKLLKVLSYHSHPTLSPLAENHWMHQIQAPLYKVLTTTQPPYLHSLISVQRPRSTRSSIHRSLLLLGHRYHPL